MQESFEKPHWRSHNYLFELHVHVTCSFKTTLSYSTTVVLVEVLICCLYEFVRRTRNTSIYRPSEDGEAPVKIVVGMQEILLRDSTIHSVRKYSFQTSSLSLST